MTLCHCGRPLHYSDPKIQAAVERQIEMLGTHITISVAWRKWRVQRHYIALHGIKASEIATLGFEEIK
jgi:hypothetical protein